MSESVPRSPIELLWTAINRGPREDHKAKGEDENRKKVREKEEQRKKDREEEDERRKSHEDRRRDDRSKGPRETHKTKD